MNTQNPVVYFLSDGEPAQSPYEKPTIWEYPQSERNKPFLGAPLRLLKSSLQSCGAIKGNIVIF